MSDFLYDPKYDRCRHHIETARQNGWSWERIATLGITQEQLDTFLVNQEVLAFWPNLGSDAAARQTRWHDIVAAKQTAEEALIAATRPLVDIGPEEKEHGIGIPQDSKTAWQLYKKHLVAQDWKSAAIGSIESSSLKILRHLKKSTLNQPPVRGLVVGHVQSGKTASMAGLIALAADHGWNLFIVLSGTLENLRIQTKNRLFKDLNHAGNLHWQTEEHPSKQSTIGQRAQDKNFSGTARHLIVSLKNSRRLEGLVEWITANPGSMSKMKILIIDDEADQGGINTADVSKEERTIINGLIVQLTKVKALSVNYVAYTATPAANFLNEGVNEDSLYPQNFIVSLPQSDEHFGPRQIFGAEESGQKPLGIVKDISHADVDATAELHDSASAGLPASLEESLIWFLCCAAAMRVYGFVKPVTMLIHTSQRQQHHQNVADAVAEFLEAARAGGKTAFTKRCNTVWNKITRELDLKSFRQRFPGYGRLAEMRDYPKFGEISAGLGELIGKVSPISLNDGGELTYHRGVHLCIDNCANNGVSEENELRRLFYPPIDATNRPDFATAFIVIGGSTLSRGLTLENLVSTYFMRASAQADSLMQMGRWFGYRKGYELLPRIWMPEATKEKFEFMTLAEEDLRDDLEQFMHDGADPSAVGPRVRVHPRASWLKPTAKNKMQEIVAADYDFSAVNRQTTIFHAGSDSYEVHRENLELSESFLLGIGSDGTRSDKDKPLVWRGVSFDAVSGFLKSFKFHPSAQFFAEINEFLKWYEQHASDAGYDLWNVVVAGTKVRDANGWKLPGGVVGRINRSRVAKRSSDNAVSIGVLRDPRDLLADTEGVQAPAKQLPNAKVVELRNAGMVGKAPQLLLYLIDKASTPRSQQQEEGESEEDPERAPLDAAEHIVGVSLWLPSAGKRRRTFVTHVAVRMPGDLANTEDDPPGTAEQGGTS